MNDETTINNNDISSDVNEIRHSQNNTFMISLMFGVFIIFAVIILVLVLHPF